MEFSELHEFITLQVLFSGFWITLSLISVRINLNVMTLNVESVKVYTVQGVPISVTGIAQVSINLSACS